MALDIDSWYGIYFYFPDSGEAYGIEYCETRAKIERFQFSTDQEYIRYDWRPILYYAKPIYDAEPICTIGEEWVAMALNKPQYIFSKKEQDKIDWAPIERPEEIPAFLTQPVPKIQKETQMQRSPDSKSLYLLDDTGVWRNDIGKPLIYQWR